LQLSKPRLFEMQPLLSLENQFGTQTGFVYHAPLPPSLDLNLELLTQTQRFRYASDAAAAGVRRIGFEQRREWGLGL